MAVLETIFIVLVMLFLAVSMRVVSREQRIALFRRGRYAGLKGPGVVLVVPLLDRECKINLGDEGILMTDGTGTFREFQIPVVFNESIATGSQVTVVGFAKDRLQVSEELAVRRTRGMKR